MRSKDDHTPLVKLKDSRPKPVFSYFEFCATAYNYNRQHQDDSQDIEMDEDDTHFQLRYKLSNKNKPESGHAVLSKNDWIDLLTNEKFEQFTDSLREFCPLNDDYLNRFHKHFGNENISDENKNDGLSMPSAV